MMRFPDRALTMAAVLLVSAPTIDEITKRQLTIDDPKAIERERAEEGGRRPRDLIVIDDPAQPVIAPKLKDRFEREQRPPPYEKKKSKSLKRLLRK